MTDDPSDNLFAPPADRWNRLPAEFVRVRQLQALVFCVIWWAVLCLAAAFVVQRWWPQLMWVTAVVAACGIAWTVWRVIRARRWVESWGWAERDADLAIAHGLWTRRLLLVPFGRMQTVDVTAGPFLRSQGLARVELVTASPRSDASIPGLTYSAAVALRDRMIELSDARGSGL